MKGAYSRAGINLYSFHYKTVMSYARCTGIGKARASPR